MTSPEPVSSYKPTQPPRFLLELLPNTHSLTLAVALPPPPPGTAKHQGLLITPLEAVVHGHSFKFPQPIDPRSIHPTVVPCSNDLVLRATALAPSSSSSSPTFPGSSAATERLRPSLPLRAAHYWPLSDLLLTDFLRSSHSLACAHCRATLTASGDGPFSTVRTLPSSSWHDLVECWACHETNVIMPTSGHLHVETPQTLWVGASHLVVHRDALVPDAVTWDGLHGKCARCATTVALRPKHVREAVHLVKPRVLALAAAGGTTAWSLAKVRAAMVLAEVLDQVTLHAAHKVAVTDLDDVAEAKRVVALVWTINWNCQVRTRSMVARRAAKVLYRVPEPGMHVRAVDELPDGYGLVVVPDAHDVLDMLQRINAELPESQQTVEMHPGQQPWRVSYLTA